MTSDPPAAPAAPDGERPRRRIDRWSAPPPDARPYRSSFIGMCGMAAVLFIILASGSVLPWYAVAGVTLVWLAALAAGTRWFLSHPTRVLLLPVGVLGVWFGVLLAGVALLDWG